MEKERKVIREEYLTYSDDELLEIASINRDVLSEEEMDVVEEILFERKMNPEKHSIEDDSYNPHLFSATMLGSTTDQDVSSTTNRLDELVGEIQKNEKELSVLLKEEYTKLSDVELRSKYEKIVLGISENNQFGSVNEADGMLNYKLLLDEITKRKITVSEEVKKAHSKSFKLMLSILSKNYRNKAILNFLIAFPVLFIALGFTWDRVFGFHIFPFYAIGIFCLVSGVNQVSKFRRLKKRKGYKEYYITKI